MQETGRDNAYVGVNWKVRILPIGFTTTIGGGLTGPKAYRDTAVNAMNYAATMGADVLSFSGGFIATKGNLSCKGNGGAIVKGGISDDNWNKVFNDTEHEFADTELLAPTMVVGGSKLLVTAAGNCALLNVSIPFYDSQGNPNPKLDTFVWPDSLNVDGLRVGSSNDVGFLSDFSASGDGLVDLYAPGENYWVLKPGVGITDDCGFGKGSCSGTSEATAMVSGVAALLIAAPSELMPPVNAPCELANRIIRNTGGTTNGVPLLEANLAMIDLEMTPICRPQLLQCSKQNCQ